MIVWSRCPRELKMQSWTIIKPQSSLKTGHRAAPIVLVRETNEIIQGSEQTSAKN